MNSHHYHDPEPQSTPEPTPRSLDPFETLGDHANQWDISAIWQPQTDPKADSLDWDLVLKEFTD